jgi:histidinol-phosphate/aromatic aminotransferase/cobyric acid decarboxylase-like protein
VRSLYKYNSISNPAQSIIRKVLESESGLKSLQKYQSVTSENIKLNIEFLKSKGLLFEHYPSVPVGPFVIVNRDSDKLFENKISSVPLNYFCLTKDGNNKNYSRISVAVNHELLKKYFNKII